MSSVIRQFVVIGLLAVAGWGGYFLYETYGPGAGGAKETQSRPRGGSGPVSVEAVTIEQQTFTESLDAVGTTRANQSIEVVPLASGRIEVLGFEPGDFVDRGAVLAKLDDDIEQANLVEAKAKLQEADQALDRAQALRRNRTVTEATLTELAAAKAVAAAELDRAQRRLRDRTILAPFAGTVGLRQVDVGARVDTDTMITTLDDLGQAIIEFSAPESLYGRITTNTRVTALSSAFPDRSFDGQVQVIDSRIDPVGRAFKVRAAVPNADQTLPAGMFMLLKVELGTREALTVPEEAVTVEGSDTYVFVVADGKAERRNITIGARQVGKIEVVDGLKVGDVVVTRGVQRLRNGTPVTIADADSNKPRANLFRLDHKIFQAACSDPPNAKQRETLQSVSHA